MKDYSYVKTNPKIEIFLNEALCKGADDCGLCIHVCPRNVYEKMERLSERGVKPPSPIHLDRCNGCMKCVIYCPDFAIVVEQATKQTRDV